MPSKTFRGGVHTPHYKALCASQAIETLPPPKQVVIPLVQHIGAPCEAVVSKGDLVALGQVIGDTDAFVSAPIHASVSGVVNSLGSALLPDGRRVPAVIIDSDGEDRWSEDIQPAGKLDDLSPDDIKQIMRRAGLVGLGGAAFPTHVKYSPPEHVKIHTVILNGCECEPFLACDHRIMLEQYDDVIFGLKAMMKASGATHGIIGIEDNKPDAIEALQAAVKDTKFEVVSLQVKYPEGAERQLISAIMGVEVPSGGLPFDIGVIVNNVGTAMALAHAIQKGHPLIERVVTVSGDVVVRPANYRVRIGTPIRALFEASGGFTEAPARIVSGGPMMGLAQYDLDAPVVKATSGLLALSSELVRDVAEEPCIRCSRCVQVCPAFLIPLNIDKYPHESALEYHPMDCIECGSCSYICPANRRLLERIRLAKAEVQARRRASDK